MIKEIIAFILNDQYRMYGDIRYEQQHHQVYQMMSLVKKYIKDFVENRCNCSWFFY